MEMNDKMFRFIPACEVYRQSLLDQYDIVLYLCDALVSRIKRIRYDKFTDDTIETAFDIKGDFQTALSAYLDYAKRYINAKKGELE